MTARNGRFAITTKDGRSVVLEFENYAQAQKYADRHFGKGAIVQLVGNRAPLQSSDVVVQNAVAANRRRQ